MIRALFLLLLIINYSVAAQDNLPNPNQRLAAPCAQKNDFSISRTPCIPTEVLFSTNATGYSNIRWDFGDGNNAAGVANTSNTYLASGNYQVTLITDYPTCSDTVIKTVLVDLQQDNQLIRTNDTTICSGTTKQLLSNAVSGFCWSPTTFLNDPNSPNPTSSATQSITYYLNSLVTGTNLITNGNFSAGNTGFTSQYLYITPNTAAGEYYVGTNPQAWYPAHFPCTDHTGGNGNMMMVNGSSTPDAEVWKTTVTVTPNTNYSFSTWICSISNPNPAQLAFSINGNSIGNLINATVPPCNWIQFSTIWNAGNSTTATISIINKNIIAFGNDFSLDDISFSSVTMRRDSVRVTVDAPVVTTNNNSTICEGATVQLNATGASTYSWTPATGLSNPNIANPIATPAITTQYIVTGTTANSCVAKDTVVITVNARPTVTTSADTTICENSSAQLFATGGITYSWTPNITLNNGNIPNPIATPTDSTMYYVLVTNANNCSRLDSVKVDVRKLNSFTISPPDEVCLNQSIQLNAAGGDLYTWTPASSLNNASVSNPVATPLTSTTYTVQITDTLCSFSSSLSTTIDVLPLPVVDADKSNDIDCSNNQSQLSATGAVQFSWAPAATLNNPSVANPIASPLVNTQYTVTGTDLSGCSNTDTITVKVIIANQGQYLMPSAFTPNGDGLNDCYRIRYWGIVESVEFSIYNRWGQRIFYSKDPNACWDGTFEGKKQGTGVFVYMIKAKTTCQPEVFRKGVFTLIR